MTLKKEVVNYPPFHVNIEPVNSCNLNCPMCFVNEIPESQKGSISLELAEKLARQDSIGTVALYLFGESMLHPKFDELIRIFKSHGKRVFLNTNGTCLNPKNNQRLFDSGLDTLSISLHTPKTTLPRVLEFLEMYKKSKSKIDVYVESINVPEERLSEADIKKIKGFGVRYILKKPHNWTGKYDIGEYKKKKMYSCSHPYYMMCICWDGTVVACCRDHKRGLIIGDANKEALAEIWNSEKMQSIRHELNHGNPPGPCKNCEKIYIPLIGIKRIINIIREKRA